MNLGENFKEYIETLQNVKLIHSEKRNGLIKARILGASAATGEVLIFLDSHCEASKGTINFFLQKIK